MKIEVGKRYRIVRITNENSDAWSIRSALKGEIVEYLGEGWRGQWKLKFLSYGDPGADARVRAFLGSYSGERTLMPMELEPVDEIEIPNTAEQAWSDFRDCEEGCWCDDDPRFLYCFRAGYQAALEQRGGG